MLPAIEQWGTTATVGSSDGKVIPFVISLSQVFLMVASAVGNSTCSCAVEFRSPQNIIIYTREYTGTFLPTTAYYFVIGK